MQSTLYKLVLVLSLLTGSVSAMAQQLSIPEMISMLDWEPFRIDTTLRAKGYLQMQKDVDSASALFQYAHFNKKEEDDAVIRSVMYMDATVGELHSRLFTYRTYDKEEYRLLSAYLLEHDYRSTNKIDFGEEKQVLYSNGKQEIRAKVISNKLKNGRIVTAYELEMGR